MKDELLMRFIDGTATPEEVETVIEILSKDDDATKEWMQMAHAARLADTPPAVAVSEHEAEKFVTHALHKAEKDTAVPSGKVRRLPWIISGVSVAAAIALVISLSFGDGSTDTGNAIHENLQAGVRPEDMVNTIVPEDSVAELPVVSIKTLEPKEYMAHTDTGADAEPEIEMKESVVSRKVNTEDISTASKGAVEFIDNAEVEAVAPVFNVLKPAKSPYRVKVKNIDKDFVFEWEASCVATMSLVITDSKGVTLMDKSLDPVEGKCPVKAAELANLGELTWILTASFEDDNIQVRTGKIELVMN